jgi:GTP-binding protein
VSGKTLTPHQEIAIHWRGSYFRASFEMSGDQSWNMRIQQATFISSSANYHQCPAADKPEIALIGRSNVGKSSLINMLVGRKRLAKTSATPGKTQLINHFLVNQTYYLVDLPGYGWAQVSQKKREHWGEMVTQYLLHRKNLVEVFVLVDIRLTPQKIDLAFIQWLAQHQLPFSIVMTKADKLSKQQIVSQLAHYQKTVAEYNQVTLDYLVTSSATHQGREAALNFIEHKVAEANFK